MKRHRKHLQSQLESASFSRNEIRKRQKLVFDFALANSESFSKANFRELSAVDLGMLFQITDEIFFAGNLGRVCEALSSSPLRFRLSKRMTSSGGMTTMQRAGIQRPEFEIAIATTPLFQTFQNEKTSKVGGRLCRNRLEALQRIMEHEMIHLAEMLVWDDSNCAATRFKTISKGMFGHTESNHQLMTPRDIARQKFKIRMGDQVRFQVSGKVLQGYVNRITKRATILVPDQAGTLYTDGARYLKYYVPVERLQRAG